MIIGITGNSGSGKSKIAQIIAEKVGAKIIDADKIAKELFNAKTEYYKEIEKKFGENITRKELANIVYSNEEKLETLNYLTKKYVVNEILEIIAQNKEKNIILDIPLLYESGLNKKCDTIIGVIADEKIKLERICKRDNISKEEAKARLKIQKNNEFYKNIADYIIENNGENLEEQINKIKDII